MAQTTTAENPLTRAALGFIAGFLATLVFHQIALAILWGIGIAPHAPYSMAATAPFGVPSVISLAFWGGLWGILFVFIDSRFPAGGGYWAAAFVFGAIFPTLVALFIVVPLKGGAVGGGWRALLWLTAILINGAWGVGTGAFMRWEQRLIGVDRSASV
ncbi:MAG TPA: hypothetical protein VKA32_04690 [Gammaproteobacteria bacterium]|nr:hypothetical protein [Gammaproteobacteria bacterium]